jgi:FkbH-like protein
LLSDKTVSSIERSLNKLLEAEQLTFTVADAGFDSWLREIVEGSNALRSGAALGFLLSPRVLEQTDARASVRRVLEVLARQSPSRTVLFSNLFPDPTDVLPLVRHERLTTIAAEINSDLYAFSKAHSWFHVVDHLGLALREGTKNLSDTRFEATAQMYFSPGGGQLVANLWLRVLRALDKPPAKVLVVDLDNTLWRGIIGEDGPDGIDMSVNAKGWGFRRLQQAMLELEENGILLAISSKNNPEEALSVLKDHADCLLRPTDFAAIEIGWGPKSEALRSIADKLNLGLDAFVFLDDSAFEREEVRRALPQVKIIDFPNDPNDLVGALNGTFAFDSARVTQEDRDRASSYAAESERDALRQQVSSPEEFFRSLSLKLTLFRAQEAHADRLHQLILKTNQFNLTSERLSGDEFRALLKRPDALVIGMRVSDKFGDSGITGVAIVTGLGSPSLVVENFLLSCRVIGRTVENGFLAWLSERAVTLGAPRINVKFKQTPRNQVAKEFLERSGLIWQESNQAWRLEVEKARSQLARHFVSIDARDI